jgi:hypothetical protein
MLRRSKSGSAGRGFVLSAVVAAVSAISALPAPALAADPVVFSFATVGDSRQDPSNPDPTTLLPGTTGSLLPQDAQWLTNSKAWTRIVRTVATQKVNALFVNGDMVMGYGRATVPTAWATTPPTVSQVQTSDLVKFYTQYAFWRGTVANSFETGTYVMPVAGNHEVQCNSSVSTNTGASACASGKHAVAENEAAFRANMGDLVGDLSTNARFQTVVGTAASNVSGLTQSTAPNNTTDASITTDQSDLSYSFDISTTGAGLLHFVVINTDATSYDGHAPVGWLAADLSAAHSRGATKIFVFGHKPAWTYNYAAGSGGTVAAAGLDATDVTGRNNFWSLITQYNATYFCGHEHTVHIDQHADPTGVNAGTPWQVLVGSGGSPFDDKLSGTCPSCVEPTLTNASDRYYAWAVVRVHQSGTVTLDAYGFNDAFGPTVTVQSIANLQ